MLKPALELSLSLPRSLQLLRRGERHGDVQTIGRCRSDSVAEPGASVAAQPTDVGVQALVVIENSEAPHSYAFDITPPAGGHLAVRTDGGIEVFGADGFSTASIAPPWAKDASGASVPTNYSLQGETLTQQVSFTTDSAFPIVADPTLTSNDAAYEKLARLYGDKSHLLAWHTYHDFGADALAGIRNDVFKYNTLVYPHGLNWFADGCSDNWLATGPAMTWYGELTNSCNRHDFAYRNPHLIYPSSREDGRHIADDILYNDWWAACGSWQMWVTARMLTCRAVINAAFEVVRIRGYSSYDW